MIKIIYMLFIIAIGSMLTVASANDSFMVTSIKDAKILSESTNRSILLIFGADYCKYCNQLKSDLFISPLKELTDRYIICCIDLEKKPKMKSEYNVSTIPDSRILKNNNQISKIKGYSPKSYQNWIKSNKPD
jgi:thioredoxin-like negative regulator of GroEL